MKSDKKILIAFLLNFIFSVLEFVGGAFTGSVAIISDSIHDFGDSISIGISYFLEKISKKSPDNKYTYGYVRYSVLGSVITTLILLAGSVIVIYNAILRILNPVPINYNGMIGLAIIGAVINFVCAYYTSGSGSLNQRSVNLHMLEDVLGWIVVLIGAAIMKITDISIIDPILSIAVAIFILINSIKNLRAVIDIFLEKTPDNIDTKEITEHLMKIDGVCDVHHLHVRSIDGFNNYATLHVVTDKLPSEIKKKVKEELLEHGISHTTVEMEEAGEDCGEKDCKIGTDSHAHECGHHRHHHHHH